jgi:hypothetical protein
MIAWMANALGGSWRSRNMAGRDIGSEIIKGLEEIKAWKRGGKKLRTVTVESLRDSKVPHVIALPKRRRGRA